MSLFHNVVKQREDKQWDQAWTTLTQIKTQLSNEEEEARWFSEAFVVAYWRKNQNLAKQLIFTLASKESTVVRQWIEKNQKQLNEDFGYVRTIHLAYKLRIGTCDGGQWFTRSLSHIFPNTELILEHEPIVEPDVLLISQFGEKHKKYHPECKRLFISGENGWQDQLKWAHLSLTTIHDPNTYTVPMYVTSYWERKKHTLQNLTEERVWQGNKTKFCAFLYFNDTPLRKSFFNALSAYKPVDALGKVMNQNPNFDAKERFHDPPGLTLYDTATLKYAGYKFVICFENTDAPHYITEKVMNGYLGGAIPIYWGASNVNEHLNVDAMVCCNGYEKDWTPVINVIKLLDQDDTLYRKIWSQRLVVDVNKWFIQPYQSLQDKLIPSLSWQKQPTYERNVTNMKTLPDFIAPGQIIRVDEKPNVKHFQCASMHGYDIVVYPLYVEFQQLK